MNLTKKDVRDLLKEGAYNIGRHARERIEESQNANLVKIMGKMAYQGDIEPGRNTKGPVWTVVLKGTPEYRAVLAPHAYHEDRLFVVTIYEANENIPMGKNYRKFEGRELIYEDFAA